MTIGGRKPQSTAASYALVVLLVTSVLCFTAVGCARQTDNSNDVQTNVEGEGIIPSLSKEERIERGRLAYQRHCKSCHSVTGEEGRFGGPMNGKWGTVVTMIDGSQATYDEEFFRESLADPGKRVTSGYSNVMVPFPANSEWVPWLIEYLRTLKAGATQADGESND
jgi:hypothetical protein